MQWRAAGGEWSLDRLIEIPAVGAASAAGTLRVATGPLSARIDGLREGVVYEVRVLALKRGDPGDPSPTASATPRPRSPAGNRAPETTAQPEIVLLEVGGQAELDLSPLFRDPDGDALTYSAASTNPEVATATVAGAALRIFGGRPGNAQIAVTAEDSHGLAARLDVRVGVVGTACSAAPAQAPEGGTAVVMAELTSAVEGSTTVRWRIMRDANPATADADAGDHGGASGEVEIRAGERSRRTGGSAPRAWRRTGRAPGARTSAGALRQGERHRRAGVRQPGRGAGASGAVAAGDRRPAAARHHGGDAAGAVRARGRAPAGAPRAAAVRAAAGSAAHGAGGLRGGGGHERLTITGESCRLREKRRAGVLKVSPPVAQAAARP